MRALGFSGMAVAVSVIAKSILLALAGALIGIGLTGALFNGQGCAFGEVLSTDGPTGACGCGSCLDMAVALLGGIVRAIRAARLRVVDALRAT